MRLQNLLNRPTENLKSPRDTPTIVPPLYGRWHAAREAVAADEAANSWFDVLNLDPRHRIAAGLGSLVVRKQQDALMASAWKQLGAIEKANQILAEHFRNLEQEVRYYNAMKPRHRSSIQREINETMYQMEELKVLLQNFEQDELMLELGISDFGS